MCTLLYGFAAFYCETLFWFQDDFFRKNFCYKADWIVRVRLIPLFVSKDLEKRVWDSMNETNGNKMLNFV